jgi:uncharacterized protein
MNSRLTVLILIAAQVSYGQGSYVDSLSTYQKEYVDKHEVITGDDKQFFRFYPVDEQYRIMADFKKATNSKWFSMETSGDVKKVFRVYGVLNFTIHDTVIRLNIYQSQSLMNSDEYGDHLFLPFADLTSGEETYDAGRYIDLRTGDIVNDKVAIDFNKAYNPYCAYVEGKYNCPLPPRENQLPVAILAGEMNFTKGQPQE